MLVFKDPVAHQVIYVRDHFTIGKAHLVPIEGLTEDYRGQFGNCLWSDLTTFGDLSAAIPMMLLQLLDSSTHTVKRGVVPGQDQWILQQSFPQPNRYIRRYPRENLVG